LLQIGKASFTCESGILKRAISSYLGTDVYRGKWRECGVLE